MVMPAAAASVTPTPISNDNNPSCEELGYANEVKFDPPANGTKDGVTVSNFVQSSSSAPGSFDWSSTFGIDAVLVKAGSDKHNLYVYSPESMGDTGLQPQSGSGNGISHISFCWDNLTQVSAAAASVTAPTCDAPGALNVPADTASIDYEVSPAYSAGATGTFTVTATAKTGFVLVGTASWELTVLPKLTGDACAASATAAAASVTAPSCSATGGLVIPANTASVTYSVSPAYTAGATGTFTVTATANAGFKLAGTTQWTLTVAPKLTGPSCEGTLAGNPTPTPAPAKSGSLPNTATDLTGGSLPVVLAAVAIAGLAVLGRQNVEELRNRR
jgi:hypothetical protein